jgi:pimeloyl-ACP methyl ester carboxylesterase
MVEFKVPTEEQIRTGIAGRQKATPEYADRILQTYMDKAADPAQGEAFAKVMKHMTHPMTRARYNTLRRLPHIHVPTLVVWGDSDKTNDVSMAHELHDGIKDSKLVVYEGIGHGVPQEAPDRFVADLNAFL